MKALGGPFGERAAAAFAAGLDIALHCNGELAEAREVARNAPELAGRALRRADAALASIAGAPVRSTRSGRGPKSAAAFEPAPVG